MISDHLDVSKEIPSQNEDKAPKDRPQDVIKDEFHPFHLANASNKWRKSPDDGKKAGYDYGLRSMFLIEVLSTHKIVLVE